jgi:hypothetical protein
VIVVKAISFKSSGNSMSSLYANYLTTFFSKGVSSSPYWYYKIYGLALYDTNGNLIKTLSNVNVSSSASGTTYYITITAQDTSTDTYTVNSAHVIATTPSGGYYSIFRASSSSTVTKGSSDTLNATYSIQVPVSLGTTSGILQSGFNAIYLDLTGQSTFGAVPISRFGIILSNGPAQVLSGFTYTTTSGTDNNIPYYGLKYSVVDSSSDAKTVSTIMLGNDANWLVCVTGGIWNKPANTSVTWWLEWRFRYGYTITSSGIPSTF